ncbi:MAG: chemotaxis protein CheX [Nitrospinota bacterium]|nr:chemotaxis protein CheX [Nitrospinota bacterium]
MIIQCQAEISQFVTDIWSSFLNMPVIQTDKAFEPQGKDNTLAACIQITGEWQGTVTVYAPKELGKKIASSMYALDESSIDDQQVQDVMGEIANMIAGNVKSLLPTPCSISIPSVAVTDFDLHHPKSETITTVNFLSDNLPFLVVMLQQKAS